MEKQGKGLFQNTKRYLTIIQAICRLTTICNRQIAVVIHIRRVRNE